MSTATPIPTGHEEMIHDAQFDYYGRRLATASSDSTIKIFEINPSSLNGGSASGATPSSSAASSSSSAQQTTAAAPVGGADASSVNLSAAVKVAELRHHQGPVWQVSWAHPKFGSMLASCGYDHRVVIWKEDLSTSPSTWKAIHEYKNHSLSINSVAWAPHEHGLCLACGSSDGYVSVLTWHEDDRWEDEKINVQDSAGVNAVSWAPSLAPETLLRTGGAAPSAAASGPGAATLATAGLIRRRFAVACCDGSIRIFENKDNKWLETHKLAEHNDWVRDVAWAPSIGLPYTTIASCSQDGTVRIWTQGAGSEDWKKSDPIKFNDVVWRVSWSVAGNILAVSCGDNKVTLWKESSEGEWKCVSSLDEPTSDQLAPQSVN